MVEVKLFKSKIISLPPDPEEVVEFGNGLVNGINISKEECIDNGR